MKMIMSGVTSAQVSSEFVIGETYTIAGQVRTTAKIEPPVSLFSTGSGFGEVQVLVNSTWVNLTNSAGNPQLCVGNNQAVIHTHGRFRVNVASVPNNAFSVALCSKVDP